MRTQLGAWAFFAALALVGCGSSSSTPSAAAPSTTHAAVPTPSTAVPTTVTAASKPGGSSVTSFGATDAAWNANHTPDSDFDPGAVYNPDPSLPQINGHTGAQYTEVLHQDGHVTGFDFHFRSEPISSAKLDVRTRNFPTDAHEVWFVVKDTCAQMLVQSRPVGQALSAPAIGDSGGFVLVEFGSGLNANSYDQSHVSDALFMLAQSVSQSDAPAC